MMYYESIFNQENPVFLKQFDESGKMLLLEMSFIRGITDVVGRMRHNIDIFKLEDLTYIDNHFRHFIKFLDEAAKYYRLDFGVTTFQEILDLEIEMKSKQWGTLSRTEKDEIRRLVYLLDKERRIT